MSYREGLSIVLWELIALLSSVLGPFLFHPSIHLQFSSMVRAAATTTTAVDVGSATNSKLITKRDVQTKLAYWKPVEGNVVAIDFTKPDGEKQFAECAKLEVEHPVSIHDIRGDEAEYTLDRNGFQYVHHEIEGFTEWSNEERVKEVLIPKTEELVRRVTGAERTLVFTHRIRCFASDESKRSDNRAPAHSVHSDFTVPGALAHLEATVDGPAEMEHLLQGRVIAMNVWRPLRTVTKDPLAICDWTSVKPKEEWIGNRFIFPHGWNELGKISYSPEHKWCYLGNQTPAEPVLFKQFDSAAVGEGGFTVAHSAFVDEEFVDEPPRESIEIKMFAFFPGESRGARL